MFSAQRIQAATVQLLPFLLAVVFHEVAHGWVAKKWGDTTAEDQGRLTLNPVPHIDPIGTLLFPLMNMLTGMPIFLGWAKPVPINPNRFRKYRQGLFWVSVAGPLSNILLAAVFTFVVVATHRFVPETFGLKEPMIQMGYAGIMINFALALFNLLPIPPLDGGKVIESVLSHHHARNFAAFERYSFIILIVLFMTGILGKVIGPPIHFLTNSSLGIVGTLFGIAG